MKISREARRLARELFRLSLADGRLDASRVSAISERLIAEKPRSYLEVLKEFSRLVRLELERRHAIVESASPLDERSATEYRQYSESKSSATISRLSFAPLQTFSADSASSSEAMSGTEVSAAASPAFLSNSKPIHS